MKELKGLFALLCLHPKYLENQEIRFHKAKKHALNVTN